MEEYEEEDDSYDYRFRRRIYEDIEEEVREAEVRDFYEYMNEDFPGWSDGL